MSDSGDLVADLLGAWAEAIAPLGDALGSSAGFAALIGELGWNLAPDPGNAIAAIFTDVSAAIADLENAAAELAAVAAGDESSLLKAIADLTAAITAVTGAIRALTANSGNPAWPAPLDDPTFWGTFPVEVVDYLLYHFLKNNYPKLFGLLYFAGVLGLDLVDTPAAGRDPYERPTVNWALIPAVTANPKSLFARVYGWGGAFDHQKLSRAVEQLLGAFGVPGDAAEPHDPTLLDPYYDPASTVPAGLLQINGPILFSVQDVGPAMATETLSIVLLPIPAAGDKLGQPVGFAIFPLAQLTAGGTIALSDIASLTVSGGFESAPIRAEIRPSGVTIATDLTATKLSALVQVDVNPPAPFILMGSSSGTRLEVAAAQFRLGADLSESQAEFEIAAGLTGLALVVDFSQADGFLQQMLGSQPQRVDFSSEIRYSSRTGFGFSGQAELAATIPVHLTIAGVLQLDTISVALQPGSDGSSAALEVGVTGGLTLGPVAVSVDKVGLQLNLKSAASGDGNLGDLDLRFGFKPPGGLGLAVDASVASGGGYIFLDPQKGEYAGIFVLAVDLPMLSVQVNVAGILDTKLPDGSPGFSLLFLLVATFDPGFELGFGFTLNGVGGLVGINRSMDLDALRAAFKSHQLETIFFPPDAQTAIANAPQTISDLAAIFPVTEGHTVFGPVLALGWGTPGIVEAEFGGILELPSFRLALFGFFTIGLPTLDEPDPAAILVLLHIDILGEIDFQKQQLSIDGELYDSRIVKFPLSGQMALRLTWGATPQFALSVGGISPQTQPPAGLPSLNRLMMSLNSSDVSLNLSAYFAATSNSLQVGANLEVHASAAGFTVHGYLGFDALFTSSPFAFAADMYGGVDVLQGSSVLVSISLELTLTGPRPFHAHGDGSFHVLFFSVSVSADLTIGDAGQAPPLPVTDVWPLLQKAWQDPRNWSATLPEGLDHAVSFAQAPTSGQTILVHPAGRLAAREKVVPLNFPFSLFGSAAPGDYGQFDVNPAHPPTLGGTAAPFEIQQDYFAPGQFQQGLSDQDKLSKPSYQLFDSVVVFGPTAVTPGNDSVLDVHYETYYVENPSIPASPSPLTYRPVLDTQLALAGQGAPALSPARLTGRTKYAVPGSKSSITTSDLGYVIASTDSLQVNTGLSAPGGASQAVTEATLQAHLRDHPEDAGSFQVIPIHEAIP